VIWQKKSRTPPVGYTYGPRYRPSITNVLRVLVYVGLRKRRSLARDALLAFWAAPEPPLLRGADRLPESGPYVIVANHYERPGLWMAWPALLVSLLSVSRSGGDVHWVAIQEWDSLSLFGFRIPPSWVRVVFERAFFTYGIVAMPSMKASSQERANALRHAAGMLKQGNIIGLMPEGDVGPTPELIEAREGVGLFLLLLSTTSPLLPVGLFEDGERLVAQVGEAVDVAAARQIAKADRDQWVRDKVMKSIRDLLPQSLWGHYR
jgi:hypothetical protein